MLQTTSRRAVRLGAIAVAAFMLLTACDRVPGSPTSAATEPAIPPEITASGPSQSVPTAPATPAVADVTALEVTGDAQAYRFAVEVSSPDLGCDLYADWWEVLREDGTLVYRRILAHSHVDEQPFVRSGGPVAIGPDTVVVVRAHMHPTGYGGAALRGTVAGGFAEADVAADFAAEVEDSAPQPESCAF
ncbi:MAG: hypothetical protein JXC32_05070 [Anaerolineae bacterium]|nr:hypothetical protein [Anaerolineae bacterium]